MRYVPRALLLAVVVGLVGLTGFGGGSGDLEVQAELTNARGLLEGNEVRVQGAPAGSVKRIELTPRNTALVTFSVNGSVPAPRADASAAVRPVDLLGDTYLSLSPGQGAEPLRGPIGLERTSNAARLDDLLRAFAPPVRKGLQALFVELGLALEHRGEDLNRAIVELRPALDATDAVMTELGSQRAGLRSLISDARHLTRQLARRDRDLGTTIDTLAATTRETAARTPGLRRGLDRLPATLARLRLTAGELERTARSARPLARALVAAAPRLSTVAAALKPFLTAARPALRDTRPLLREVRGVLRDGAPALGQLAGGARRLNEAAPELNSFMDALVPAAAPISDGFFVHFADQAAEPGTQPFDPTADPRRNYWRGAAVFTCEAFGVPIAPNCLLMYLRSRAADRKSRKSQPAPVRKRPPADSATPAPKAPALNDAPVLRRPPELPDTSSLEQNVPALLDFLLGQ